jgi:hypothetical protein
MTKWDSSARPDPDAESGVRDDGTTITPIEAVIDGKSSKKLHAAAEMSAQISEERQKRASAPVHMEGLKPLPAGMARMPNGVIPGGSDATTLVPSMRRSVPAPFKRESVNVGRHGKTWQYLPADQVAPGDIVVDFGRVVQRASRIRYGEIAGRKVAVGDEILLVNPLEEVRPFDPADQIRVFRVHGGPEDEALA